MGKFFRVLFQFLRIVIVIGIFLSIRKCFEDCCKNLCLHPGVRAEQSHRGDVLGQFLPGPQLRPGQSGAGRDHRPHSKDGASQYN